MRGCAHESPTGIPTTALEWLKGRFDSLTEQRDRALSERDKARAERDRAVKEQDRLRGQLRSATAERDKLRAYVAQVDTLFNQLGRGA